MHRHRPMQSRREFLVAAASAGVPAAVVKRERRFALGRQRQLRARPDGPPVKGTLQAKLPRIAGDLVAEDADVVENRPELARDLLGIGQRVVEPPIEGIVVQDAAERPLAAVKAVGERDELFQQFIHARNAAVEVIDDL